MDERFKNKYRTSSARLPSWDYGSHGLYYITICTRDRSHYFGDIIGVETQDVASLPEMPRKDGVQGFASLRSTSIGDVAYNNWIDIPSHFPFVELDKFVVMPNHVHGILFINKPDKTNWEINKFGPQSKNLGSIIRGYKSSVKTYSTLNNIEFAWQSRYHDRIIRDQKEYLSIREYISNNPQQWLLNGDNEDNLFQP